MTNSLKPTPETSDAILIVDDDDMMVSYIKLVLQSEGFNNIDRLDDGAHVLQHLEDRSYRLILLDIGLPGKRGDEVLVALRELYPETPVVMITAEDDMETAIACMRAGAQDYLVKPFEASRLARAVQRVLELTDIKAEYQNYLLKSMQESLDHPEAFRDIVTVSPTMRLIFQYIETIARSRKPVLITGASGVGKELLAKAVHKISAVSGPYVTETVAGYDDAMFSDALFGHVAGAYTGAANARPGLVHAAELGTLFLDEIGDLSLASQVKLLRLVQENEYRALGTDKTKRSTARFIFATNRDLQQMQQDGSFRRDLFFRISVHHIRVPRLTERKCDIAPLVHHFVSQASKDLGGRLPGIPPELVQLLHNYSFPGNVRELESMVFDAVAKSMGSTLSLRPFMEHIDRQVGGADPVDESGGASTENHLMTLETLPTLAEARELLITEAIRRAEGNQGIAARMLGISRTALNKRLNQG